MKFSAFFALALAVSAFAQEAAPEQQGSPLMGFLPFILMFVVSHKFAGLTGNSEAASKLWLGLIQTTGTTEGSRWRAFRWTLRIMAPSEAAW